MPISKIVTNSIANANVTAVKIASGVIPEVPQVIKPSFTSPANNATGILETQLFTATSYLSLYGRSQANANWEISTSPTFAFINIASTITGSNTQFRSNLSSGLVANTVHYIRVRYSDDANNSSEYSNTVQFTTNTTLSFPVNFLVVGGGGGGGVNRGAGGGGAGGYRASLGTSGGPSSAESSLNLLRGTNYTVTVGAGGSGGVSPGTSAVAGTNGSSSIFSTITSSGGGVGGCNINPWTAGGAVPFSGAPGGSGGGGGATATVGGIGGSGTPGQGNDGGTSTATALNNEGGAGGGGASTAGTPNATNGTGTAGGNGISSDTLFGSAVTRGGGGGGAGWGSGAAGGTGGGGTGKAGAANPSSSGTINTGGGGGGGGGQPSSSGSGGSGIVILHYPIGTTISNPGGGLTYTTATVSGNTVTTFTAGTGNVSWS